MKKKSSHPVNRVNPSNDIILIRKHSIGKDHIEQDQKTGTILHNR